MAEIRRAHRLQGRDYVLNSLAANGNSGNDRNGEQCRDALLIGHDATRGGLVEHVQRQDERHAHLRELHRQQECPAGIRGIANLHDRAQLFVEQHARSHLLILGS